MWPENLSWQYALTIHIHAITAHMFAMSLSIWHATSISPRSETHQLLSSQLAVSLRLVVLQSWSCCWWLQPLGPVATWWCFPQRSWCPVSSSMDGVLCDQSSLFHNSCSHARRLGNSFSSPTPFSRIHEKFSRQSAKLSIISEIFFSIQMNVKMLRNNCNVYTLGPTWYIPTQLGQGAVPSCTSLREAFGMCSRVCRRIVGTFRWLERKWRWLEGKINLSTSCKEV